MGFLITTLILFAFTLLVPGLASVTDEERAKAAYELSLAKLDLANSSKLAASGAKEEAEAAINLAKAQKEQSDALLKLAEVTGAGTDALKFFLGVQQDAEKELEKTNEKYKEQIEEINNLKAASKGFAKSFVGDLAGMAGMTKKFENTFVGSFLNAAQESEGLMNVLKNVGKEMKETFSAENIAASGIAKLIEATVAVAKEQDEAISSFIRATGTNRELAGSISDVYFNTRLMGVTMGEAAAAAESLYTNMAIFSRQNRETRNELIKAVSLMNEFGISNDIATESLDVMTRVLGMSATEAARTSEEMANFAERIGVPPARLIQELSATAPSLAQFGDRTTEVLMDLTAVAKATGIELNALVGIADRFDTFEGAAEAAGRLNSILGGPFLNSIELLTAEPADKIRLLGQAIMDAGIEFSQLDRFEKQAIAATAGINDMTQAAAIFGGNLEEGIANLEAQNQALIDFEERARDAQSFTDQMTIAFQSFAVEIRPLINLVKELLMDFSRFVNFLTNTGIGKFLFFGTVISGLVLTTTAFIASLFALPKILATVSTALGVTTGAVAGLTFALRGLMALTGLTLLIGTLGTLAGIFMPQSPALYEYIEKTTQGFFGLGAIAREITPSLARFFGVMEDIPSDFKATAAVETITTVDAKNAARMLKSSVSLSAGAFNLVAAKTTATDMSAIVQKMSNENRQYMNKLEQIATKPFVAELKGRELVRFVKEDVINRSDLGGRGLT